MTFMALLKSPFGSSNTSISHAFPFTNGCTLADDLASSIETAINFTPVSSTQSSYTSAMVSNSLILLTLIVFVFEFAFADGGAVFPKGKIRGAVADAQTQKPLEYATVALYSASDNKLINGTITDYLGHFKIDQPQPQTP